MLRFLVVAACLIVHCTSLSSPTCATGSTNGECLDALFSDHEQIIVGAAGAFDTVVQAVIKTKANAKAVVAQLEQKLAEADARAVSAEARLHACEQAKPAGQSQMDAASAALDSLVQEVVDGGDLGRAIDRTR